MRNLFFVLLAGVTLAVMSGCCAHRGCGPFGGCSLLGGVCGQCGDCPETCESCEPCADQGCLAGCGGRRVAEVVDAGPPSAAITYPYYTTRGPRDFLARNPRSIGP